MSHFPQNKPAFRYISHYLFEIGPICWKNKGKHHQKNKCLLKTFISKSALFLHLAHYYAIQLSLQIWPKTALVDIGWYWMCMVKTLYIIVHAYLP